MHEQQVRAVALPHDVAHPAQRLGRVYERQLHKAAALAEERRHEAVRPPEDDVFEAAASHEPRHLVLVALRARAGLGEVQLLGLLSELFTFTALRFNTARTTFQIDGAKLTFPDLTLRGANSVIEAHGNFALDRRELDFKAKVFPFQESQSLLKNVVGAVLTPFSNIFEVKLSGTLDKPDWSFVASPTNLFRSLAPADTAPTPAPPLEHPAITPSASALPKP